VQYLFVKTAGEENLILQGDEHRYIFKVRRHREGEFIALRNLVDENLYFYKISSLTKKEALLTLEKFEKKVITVEQKLHLAWCMIDPKNIEKVLPTLNELGVDKITFIYCNRSQKSFKVDFKRLEKILLNSSQQCGRSSLMQLCISDSLANFLAKYPDTVMLNFSENSVTNNSPISTILIGCEGGFSQEETEMFKHNVVGLETPLILKSESAVCAVASKLLT
jgi:16S rRNA (uracil1498-N3)-methyltransferase